MRQRQLDEPRPALVLWADQDSPNLGVRALADGTAELLRRAWPNAQVEYQNYGLTGTAPFPIGHSKRVLRDWISGDHYLGAWLKGFDVVVDTRAGDSFADIYGLERLRAMSLIAEYAHRIGVPVILGPQTLGPFHTRRGKLMARRSMKTAQLRMVRDSASVAQADELGRPAHVLTTDVVFALPVPKVDKSRDVVLNVSGLLWHPGPHVDAALYRRTVRDVFDGLLARGRTVTLLAHVLDSPNADNDVSAVRAFAAEHAPSAEVVVPQSLDDVRHMLAGAELVLGSRMHACLNALSVGTPAVAMAYSRKFEPLMRDLGWRHTVDMRDPEGAAESVLKASEQAFGAEVAQLNERAAAKLEVAVMALRAVL